LCELRVRSVAFCGPRPISALRTSNAALRTHVLRRHGLRRRTQTPSGHSSASPTRRVIICTSRRDSGRPRESLCEIFRSFAARSTSDGFPANSVFFEGNSSALHNPQAPPPNPTQAAGRGAHARFGESVDDLVQRTLRPCNSSPARKAPKSWRWDDWFSARLSDRDEGQYRSGPADEMHPENSLAVRPR
jgi:hypothetical protein